jgi:Tol biopolymer transport system component
MRRQTALRRGFPALAVGLACALSVPAWGSPSGISRASVASDGQGANSYSFSPSLSARGDLVAFDSFANNLVEGDDNARNDVFVRDCRAGTTERVSVASDGAQANGASDQAEISANGRFVAFSSWANNLVADDQNGNRDVFVHDRTTGETRRVSVVSDGSEAQGGTSSDPSISADGRLVAFSSTAVNLSAVDTNGGSDVFVHDTVTGATELVSVGTAGTAAGASFSPAMSGTGRFVAFSSVAPDVVSDDTNDSYDIFVRDRRAETTERASVASDGSEALGGHSMQPGISRWGRFVAFHSGADNLVPYDGNFDTDVFLHNRKTRITERISETATGGDANGRSLHPSVSAGGRQVVFASFANNLAPDDGLHVDIFRYRRLTGTIKLVSRGRGGPANDDSDDPVVSGWGRIVAFHSRADNLVAGDDNFSYDVFVWTPP